MPSYQLKERTRRKNTLSSSGNVNCFVIKGTCGDHLCYVYFCQRLWLLEPQSLSKLLSRLYSWSCGSARWSCGSMRTSLDPICTFITLCKVVFPKCQFTWILRISIKRGVILDMHYRKLDSTFYQINIGCAESELVYKMYIFLLIKLAAIAFIGEMVPERKRKLALYPVSLFYLFLSWFVLIIWFFNLNFAGF